MFQLDTFETTLKKTFKQIKKSQADILAVQIAANFTAGKTAASKHQSSIPSQYQVNTQSIPSQIFSAEPEEDEGLTDSEKATIAVLIATYLAYLSKFNGEAQTQILSHVKELVGDGREEEVKGYLDGVFSGEETITIDNVGKKKKEIYVDKNLKLSEVETVITKPYVTSIIAYVGMLGSTVSHGAYEAGRKAQNIKDGYDRWVFVGPADERARAWHVALLGSVLTYNTQQSEYAERCLREPRCRHRAVVYWNDPTKDTAPEIWEKLKKKNGLFWNQEKESWDMK